MDHVSKRAGRPDSPCHRSTCRWPGRRAGRRPPWRCRLRRRAMSCGPTRCGGWAFTAPRRATILGLLAGEPALAARIVADLPYIMAEVVYACRYEMALHLDDILTRRCTSISRTGARAGGRPRRRGPHGPRTGLGRCGNGARGGRLSRRARAAAGRLRREGAMKMGNNTSSPWTRARPVRAPSSSTTAARSWPRATRSSSRSTRGPAGWSTTPRTSGAAR